MKLNSIALSTTIASLIRSLSAIAASTFLAALPVNAQLEIKDVKRSADDLSKFIVTFRVLKDGKLSEKLDLKSILVNGNKLSEEELKALASNTEIPPLRFVILLDYSGSMRNLDQSGKNKLKGATDSIKEFVSSFAEYPSEVKFSVVPFAAGCRGEDEKIRKKKESTLLFDESNTEKNHTLLGGFYSIKNLKELNEKIDNLAKKENLCDSSSTNLFEATKIAMKFLTAKPNESLYPRNRKQPKLILVILSDGFNTYPLDYSEQKSSKVDCTQNENELGELENKYLKPDEYSSIIVYTIGYGRKDSSKFNCKDVDWSNSQIKDGKINADEFVDEDALKRIADSRSGSSYLRGNAEDLKAVFQIIYELTAGTHKIEFSDPKADAGDQLLVKVSLTTTEGKELQAEYKYTVPAYPPMKLEERIPFLVGGVITFFVLGGIPFWYWRKGIKSEESK